MSNFSEIKASVHGKVGLIRFDRKQARNALTDLMLAETQDQMRAWELDKAISCIVLTGDEDAFCAGGDVNASAASQLGAFDKYRMRHTQSEWHNFMRFLGNYTKPVIAAIEGYALGGGLEIALRCDFAVGSQTAQLGLTEAKLSLFPILGGAWSLADAVGARMARELLYTARRIGAQEAKELGILNHVVPAGAAIEKALEIAGQIAVNGPLAVMAAKQAVNRARSQTFEEALSAGGDLSALLMFSQDRREGLDAFKEKREPDFRGE